jgi:hypothetical protein
MQQNLNEFFRSFSNEEMVQLFDAYVLKGNVYLEKDILGKAKKYNIPESILIKSFNNNIIRECARRFVYIIKGEKK